MTWRLVESATSIGPSPRGFGFFKKDLVEAQSSRLKPAFNFRRSRTPMLLPHATFLLQYLS